MRAGEGLVPEGWLAFAAHRWRISRMIDRKHDAIFVHVPKTGGQSVEKVLLELNGLKWEERAPMLLRKNADPAVGPERLAHITAAEYVSLGHVTREDFDRMFKFAFVRNPWSRMVSAYLYRDLEHDMSFARFVEQFLDYDDRFLNDTRHAMPQAEYLYDEEGTLLVDFVGRFERIAADFAEATEQMGLGRLDLPHKNKSDNLSLFLRGPRSFAKRTLKSTFKSRKEDRRSHYSEYYTPELRDRVGEFYARDVELFDYSFEDRR
jgi:hypothetical protein